MMSTGGQVGGIAAGNSGTERQNLPCAQNKYSQMANDARTIIGAPLPIAC
jgi:hypothetical protein